MLISFDKKIILESDHPSSPYKNKVSVKMQIANWLEAQIVLSKYAQQDLVRLFDRKIIPKVITHRLLKRVKCQHFIS